MHRSTTPEPRADIATAYAAWAHAHGDKAVKAEMDWIRDNELFASILEDGSVVHLMFVRRRVVAAAREMMTNNQ